MKGDAMPFGSRQSLCLRQWCSEAASASLKGIYSLSTATSNTNNPNYSIHSPWNILGSQRSISPPLTAPNKTTMSPEDIQALKAGVFIFGFFALFAVGCAIYYTISKNRQIRRLKAATKAVEDADLEAQHTDRDTSMELGTVKKATVNSNPVYALPIADLGTVTKPEVYTSSVYDYPLRGGDMGTAGRRSMDVRGQVAATLCEMDGSKEQDAGTVRLEDVWEIGSIVESVAPESPPTDSWTGCASDRSAAADSVSSDDTRSTSSLDSKSLNEWDDGQEEVQSRRRSSHDEHSQLPESPTASPTGLAHVYGSHY